MVASVQMNAMASCRVARGEEDPQESVSIFLVYMERERIFYDFGYLDDNNPRQLWYDTK